MHTFPHERKTKNYKAFSYLPTHILYLVENIDKRKKIIQSAMRASLYTYLTYIYYNT